jgi:arsenical pump membrane protein
VALREVGSLILSGVGKGTDVYLFLVGMMLLSEVARREGLFDWVATHAVNAARGSPMRLFAIVYGAGVVVTAFLSNDATAVVLTPAVAAAAKKAKANPLPFLFICAFVANAASFVLPISNPANLVVYGERLPPLADWFTRLAAPAIAAIVVTYFALRWTQRRSLTDACTDSLQSFQLSSGGVTALIGIIGAASALIVVSARGIPLGLPTAALACATVIAVTIVSRANVWLVLKSVQWGIVPFVAVLFAIVEALERAGAVTFLAARLQTVLSDSETYAAVVSGVAAAIAGNVANNLPVGLLARSVLSLAQAGARATDAVLIGVDLVPNLSVTGSLATILWLGAIRRDGERVSAWNFLKVGCVVMFPALAAALAVRLLLPR